MRVKIYILLFAALVLLFGCTNNSPSLDSELIVCADAPTARASACVAVLNKCAYILGGRTGADWSYPTDVWQYNPIGDKWSNVGNMPMEGRVHMVCAVLNNVAYIGGGFAGDYKDPTSYKSDWWSFDGTKWTQLPDIPTKFTDGLIAFCANGKIYAGYGYNKAWTAELFVFDPVTNSWSEDMAPDYKEFTLGLSHTAAQSGSRIFAGLGFDTYNVNNWSEYDAGTNMWKRRAALPCDGGVFFASAGTSTHVLVAGGRAFGGSEENGQIYDKIWAYDIVADKWSVACRLPQPSENMIGFTIDDMAYFGLGEDADGNRLSSLYKLKLSK